MLAAARRDGGRRRWRPAGRRSSRRTIDLQSGVDPLSLDLRLRRHAGRRGRVRPDLRLRALPAPGSPSPPLKAGTPETIFVAGDFQEDKNVDQAGEISSILPNTAFVSARSCASSTARRSPGCSPTSASAQRRDRALLVVAGATRRIDGVAFSVDGTPIATATHRNCRPVRDDVDGPAASARGRTRCGRRSPTPTGRQPRRRSRQGLQEEVAVDERVAVITGGSSGIGAELAREAARAGAGRACSSHAARSGCASSPARSAPRRRSATSATGRRSTALAARVTARHPRIKLLVNNAGIPGAGGLHRRRARADRGVIARVNYLGGVWCLRAFLPGARGGRARGRRQRRLGRGHGGDPALGPVRGVEARAARVLPRDRSAAPRAAGSRCTPSSRASRRRRASRSAA